MKRPFASLSRSGRRRAIGGLVAAQVVELKLLLDLERRMRRTGGPGIIPFELAGSAERAQQIMDTWGDEGRAAATRSLLLDYPYPATYAPFYALVCTAVADGLESRGSHALASVGDLVAWGQFAAAMFDYVENTTLLLILAGRDGGLPGLARRAALTKFALSLTGLGYVLLGLGLVARDRWRR